MQIIARRAKGGMELSDHAVQRCTQRGIRALQDEWLRKFGVRIWKYGAEIYLFDHDVFDGLLQSVCSQDRQLAEKIPQQLCGGECRSCHYGRSSKHLFLTQKTGLHSAAALGLVPILKAFRANLALVY